MSRKSKWLGIVILSALFLTPNFAWSYDSVRVGTWKTPQTIQPFFYEEYLPAAMKIRVLPFTNPADQKTALLAKSLDMIQRQPNYDRLFDFSFVKRAGETIR